MPEEALTVLVVDDEPAMREVLTVRLAAWGYRVLTAGTGTQARDVAERSHPEVVISDVVLPELRGLDLLDCLKAGDPDRPVILITAHGSIDEAVEAMKRGAQDFLTKPLDYDKLEATLAAVRSQAEQRLRRTALESRLDEGVGLGELIGASAAIRGVLELLPLVAASEAAAIITGESGTGKELVARAIHTLGPRRDGPFVALNAAAIPETLMESELFGHEKGAFTGALASRPGCFEQAHHGTLFLDEITEMPAALQSKFLRVLEGGSLRRVGGRVEIRFDVRVVAATNHDIQEAVESGRLRHDLYYRLNVFTISLPPLRDRQGDVPLLAQHFVRQFNRKHNTNVLGVADDTMEVLENYTWPGNVRELRNVIERAVVLAREDWLEPSHLPLFLPKHSQRPTSGIIVPPRATAAEAERIVILETLKRVDNNKAEAARQLGLDVKTIRNKLRTWTKDAGGR
jgi:DNA-binding NtrC family response regulator